MGGITLPKRSRWGYQPLSPPEHAAVQSIKLAKDLFKNNYVLRLKEVVTNIFLYCWSIDYKKLGFERKNWIGRKKSLKDLQKYKHEKLSLVIEILYSASKNFNRHSFFKSEVSNSFFVPGLCPVHNEDEGLPVQLDLDLVFKVVVYSGITLKGLSLKRKL